jgi:hypothetical protein
MSLKRKTISAATKEKDIDESDDNNDGSETHDSKRQKCALDGTVETEIDESVTEFALKMINRHDEMEKKYKSEHEYRIHTDKLHTDSQMIIDTYKEDNSILLTVNKQLNIDLRKLEKKLLNKLNQLKEMEKKYNIEKQHRFKTAELYAKSKLPKKIYEETIAICRDNIKDLKSEVDRLDTKLQNRLCICCFGQKSDTVLLPCSHLRTCLKCTRNLVKSGDKCGFCGSEISGYIKVNLK